MPLNTNLVITDVADGHRQVFLDLADAMELSRGQLLALLLAGAGAVSGGLDAAIPDHEAQVEWRALMANRLFSLTNL
ncbi:MAG: hypothetical protein C9355_11890 [Thalassolituus maritimus]|uniref:Uncharacterized protein n=1 Tax=Thalassolituus maritimus TaxID=484498 RepID=A0A1N7PFI3_9GAMM|nr:hypothetical protein [Thalassolituus maritimus]TPD53103.1 MAG: hypothetical protein C9355_11890 [Thalassolituus maritimus]SIT09297.1 hypothetical protein SAMN05421686_109150 [Thalassolituus maritimus]